MHDIVIRGGTIIDGTGQAPFTGDIAIAGDRIAAVGGKQGPAKREIDASGTMKGIDHFTEQAFGLLTSSRLADALDLSKEDPRTVDRYGTE